MICNLNSKELRLIFLIYQKIAISEKPTVFIWPLQNLAITITSWVNYFGQVSYMEIRQKLGIFHHWPIFGSVHFFYPEFGFSFLNLYVKLHFSSKILSIQGGGEGALSPTVFGRQKWLKTEPKKQVRILIHT